MTVCTVCGKDLTPTKAQIEALRRFGNPLRREPCLLTRDGLHRVTGSQLLYRDEGTCVDSEVADAG